MRPYWLDLSDPAHKILYVFGLSARGKTELEILKQLSHGSANVYELRRKRLRDIDVHYSTVLRAFRRLEKKKLVKVVSSKKVGRRRKTYDLTLIGKLIVALARNGMNGATKMIADNSQSFRECASVHSSLRPWQDYPSSMTSLIIWNILESGKGETATLADLDFLVRKIELEWARTKLEGVLYNLDEEEYLARGAHPVHLHHFYSLYESAYDSFPLSRPEMLKYLRKITHIDWLAEWAVQTIEKYVKRETEWLQA
ncbi:hypothetical protein GTO27_05660, partial [Candidatus Bathyarchaeota archaeon]|nr:hypothetical protein [Candidatus Bathyarchaeota archaeon]